MNLVMLTNLLWISSKTIQEYQDKLNSFTAKYVSSPVMGYVVFGVVLFLAVVFIRAYANK